MEFLFADWLGTPAWFWLAFITLVIALTAFDLGVLNKEDKEMGIGESLRLSALYIGIAMAFGAWVWAAKGGEAGLQYYIWNNDLSGRILLAELVRAADRGVHVRLLIDDNTTAGLDPMLAGANAHPRIEVRLFNPLTLRSVRAANYLFAFPRLNRRMHNKSLTIDGAVTIVGGRNVGDEYFGAEQDGLFIDMDALVVGKVVPQHDNYFAALNCAVFSDGTFVYIPEGVRCPMELSTYFRINAENTGQFERTLIIADKGSYVSYLEGCTAPMRDENQLHAAVVELVALDDAEIKYSTVQNWYPGDENGKGGIYNFVTKRAL
eukprot:gene43493-54023_t